MKERERREKKREEERREKNKEARSKKKEERREKEEEDSWLRVSMDIKALHFNLHGALTAPLFNSSTT